MFVGFRIVPAIELERVLERLRPLGVTLRSDHHGQWLVEGRGSLLASESSDGLLSGFTVYGHPDNVSTARKIGTALMAEFSVALYGEGDLDENVITQEEWVWFWSSLSGAASV